MKTVVSSEGRPFNYKWLYSPAIIRASQEWYDDTDLESLFLTIDRWERGERPKSQLLLTTVVQEVA